MAAPILRAQINVLALRPHIPSLFLSHLPPIPFAPLSERRRKRRWKVREDAEWSSTERLPVSEGCMKEMSIKSNTDSTGPSSHLSSSACFLKAPSEASLHWNEGPLHPLLAQQAIQIKEPNAPLSCCWWTWAEGIAFSYSPLSLLYMSPSLPSSLQHHPALPPIFQYFLSHCAVFLLIPSITLRVAFIQSPPVPIAPPLLSSPSSPPHISVGALLCAGEGHAATGSYLGM